MSTFRGGPVDGVTLMFHRAPLFLRVVVDDSEEELTGHPNVDVLDMLDDEPKAGEQVHVYRRVGPSRPAHLNYRGSKKGASGWYEFADYEHVEVPDDERARLRGTFEWREWVMSQ